MIVVAPDKFKGTLSQDEAARAICRGLCRAGAGEDSLRFVRIGDGGEGTAEALEAYPIESHRGAYSLGPGEALVMSCDLAGRNLADVEPRHRSTRLLGETVSRLGERFPTIYIGVGGTLTADGGLGFLQGLGFRLYDASGVLISADANPAEISHRGLSRAEAPTTKLPRIIGLCDVRGPLISPDAGLTALDFVEQKGLSRGETARVFEDVCRCVESSTDDFGAAGGGLGYAIGAVPGGECRSGVDFVLERLSQHFAGAKLVITGEGRIDAQTPGGKTVDGLYRFCSSRGIPMLAVGGTITSDAAPYPLAIACQSPGSPLPSPADAFRALEDTVERWARENPQLWK